VWRANPSCILRQPVRSRADSFRVAICRNSRLPQGHAACSDRDFSELALGGQMCSRAWCGARIAIGCAASARCEARGLHGWEQGNAWHGTSTALALHSTSAWAPHAGRALLAVRYAILCTRGEAVCAVPQLYERLGPGPGGVHATDGWPAGGVMCVPGLRESGEGSARARAVHRCLPGASTSCYQPASLRCAELSASGSGVGLECACWSLR
jgi:hypothetical protein